MTLTTSERETRYLRARYATALAALGASPGTAAQLTAAGHGRPALQPPPAGQPGGPVLRLTGPQRRRIRHKQRRAGAAPARLATGQQRRADADAAAAERRRLDLYGLRFPLRRSP